MLTDGFIFEMFTFTQPINKLFLSFFFFFTTNPRVRHLVHNTILSNIAFPLRFRFIIFSPLPIRFCVSNVCICHLPFACYIPRASDQIKNHKVCITQFSCIFPFSCVEISSSAISFMFHQVNARVVAFIKLIFFFPYCYNRADGTNFLATDREIKSELVSQECSGHASSAVSFSTASYLDALKQSLDVPASLPHPPLPLSRHSHVRDEVINNCRHILYTLLVFFTSGISQFFARISSSSFSLYLAAFYVFLFCLFIHHFTFSSSLAVLSFLTIQARHVYLLFTLKLNKFMSSFPVV